MTAAAAFAVLLALAPQTIWKSVTGFYGTRAVVFDRICQSRYMGDRFAFARLRIHGRRHDAALHHLDARRGWVVMWADGTVNRKIGASTRPLVLAEVTRLKTRCLAP